MKPNAKPEMVAKITLGSSKWAIPKIKADATMEKPIPYFRKAERTTPRNTSSSMKGTRMATTAISSRIASRESALDV